MADFDGLVVAVTGAASGIGAATSAMLAGRGARVVGLDREPPTAPADGVRYVVGDVTVDADLVAAVASIEATEGALDVLVNNAGIGAAGGVDANDRTEWHRVLDVNVVSAARLTALALPLLRRSTHAAVVNVSSVAALVGLPQRVLYSASKGAVAAMTLAAAADLLADGVRVNAVTPGTADTPWVQRLLAAAADPEATAAALRARQPMGRLVTAEEVAHAICYLASPLSGSTTGTLLGVDGGLVTLRV